jgi:hypothetical protein
VFRLIAGVNAVLSKCLFLTSILMLVLHSAQSPFFSLKYFHVFHLVFIINYLIILSFAFDLNFIVFQFILSFNDSFKFFLFIFINILFITILIFVHDFFKFVLHAHYVIKQASF